MFTQALASLRTPALVALAAAALAPAARAGESNTTFVPATRNGPVNIFFTDLSGTTLTATANVTAAMNAAQKRAAVQTAITNAGLPAGWTVAGAGATLTVRNANNLSMVANFNPRGTGEVRDSIVVPGGQPTTFPGGHGNMDPHAPQGMSLSNGLGGAAIFNAGVVVGNTEYVYTLSGNDPRLVGLSSVDQLTLTNYLYQGLSSLSLPAGVTITNSGSSGIDADFSPSVWSQGNYGIVWGTDSFTGDVGDSGFRGTMTNVPAPGALALAASGGLLTLRRRR